MHAVVWYITIPAIINCLAAMIAALTLRKTPARRNIFLQRFPIAAAVSVLIFTLLHIAAVLLFSSDATPIPGVAVIVASLCLTVGIAVPKTDDFQAARPRLCRFFRQVGVIAVTLLAAELLIFNFQSLSLSYDQTAVSAVTAKPENGARINGDHVTMKNGSSVTVTQACEGANAVGLRFTPGKSPIRLTISAKDDNFSEESMQLLSRTVRTDTGLVFIPINTYGTVYELTITVSDVKNTVELYDVIFSNALPFSFSALRYLVLLGIGFLVAAVITGRLHLISYDRTKRSHAVIVSFCMALCLSLPIAMLVPYFIPAEDVADDENGDTSYSIAYPFENDDAASRDAYVQQFDAFQKGQLHLDIEPHETLTALENPYDHSLRHGDNTVYYQWDRAYYEGKYYSYFGVAPVFTFYYPFYWLTGTLPLIPVASGFFTIGATLFLFALLLRLIKMFCKRPNMLLLCLGLIATTATSGLWWQHMQANNYTLPICAGLCFLFMTLWAGLCAYDTKNRFVQLLCFFLCGVGVCLTVASRPTLVLSALILAPVFIHVLVRRDYSVKRKIVSALSFVIPVGIGAALIMLYNQLRFGSPFEFGATYQLTVSNIAANTVTLSLLPAAIYHYFLQPFTVSDQFPFIRPMYSVLQGYGRYVYIDTTIGALAIPSLLTGMAGLPAVARRAKASKPVWFWMLILTPILALLAAFCNFCLGGVNIRYTADVLPLISIIMLPLMLELYHRLDANMPQLKGKLSGVFAAILVGSIILSMCFTLWYAATSTIVTTHYPQLLPTLEDIIVFWR